ncbi:MAG: Fic family protein [Cyanobacteriota bacterium]
MIQEKQIDIFYKIQDSVKLKSLLNLSSELNDEINWYKHIHEDVWVTLQDKIIIDWIYHSNAIEGNTLTRKETGFFLKYDLTIKGKPLKDFLEAKNHSDAIHFLFDVIKDNRTIEPFLIKEFNTLLLSGITYTKSINKFGEPIKKILRSGQYKIDSNHVQQLDGTIHYYLEPIYVSEQINYIFFWLNENIDLLHPIVTSAIAHYNFLRIHPFDNGNGTVARLLMNTILMKKKYLPIVIKNENREDYIEFLIKADNGDLEPFIYFIAQSLIETEKLVLHELKNIGKNDKK